MSECAFSRVASHIFIQIYTATFREHLLPVSDQWSCKGLTTWMPWLRALLLAFFPWKVHVQGISEP